MVRIYTWGTTPTSPLPIRPKSHDTKSSTSKDEVDNVRYPFRELVCKKRGTRERDK